MGAEQKGIKSGKDLGQTNIVHLESPNCNDSKRKGQRNDDCRFTVEEGVPGVWLQHICPVVRGAAAPLQAPRLNVLWETAVTGQGLWDVIHAVHLQAGLVFKNSPQRCNVRKEAALMLGPLHMWRYRVEP